MIGLYNQYFRFPILDYRMSTDVAVASIVGALVVATLGAWSAVRRAVRIPPAEAMRPEPPASYHRSVFEGRLRLPMATRMILRNLERQPMRTMVSGRSDCGAWPAISSGRNRDPGMSGQ